MSQQTASDEKPAGYVTLPGFPGITVIASECSDGAYELDYRGWPDELIAAGVLTPERLERTGRRLPDPDGGKVSVTKYWRLTAQGIPARYCLLRRRRSFADLVRWPGALDALESRRRCVALDREERPWVYSEAAAAAVLGRPPAPPAPRAGRPALWLIVNNTD